MPAAPAAITDPKDETGEIRLPVAKLCILNSVLSLEPPGPDWAALKPNPSEHEVFTAIPDVISRSAGAGRIDAFTLRINLGKNETRAHDYLRLSGFNEQWEIRALDDEGEPNTILAWGVAVQDTVDMGERSESVHTTCRLDDNLFGIPLTSYPILDPVTHEERSIELPLVWNPEREVNGTPIIEPNLITWSESVGSGVVTRYYVQDPDSRRTDASTTFQETTGGGFTLPSASLATLAEVAFLLCTRLNAAETWIENPADVGEISAQLGEIGLDQTILKNQLQSYGNYLPKALDELLTPHGCGWYLEHSLVDPTPALDPPAKVRVSTIRFYRRGEGMKVSLKRAASGVKAKQNTNVNSARVATSLVDLANVVHVFGDYEKREATFYLSRAWAVEDDSIPIESLAKGQPKAIEKPFVGRKLVLNEAGDYIGLRPEITVPYPLDDLFKFTAHDGATTYQVGQKVTNGSRSYQCLTEHSGQTPPGDNWEDVGSAQSLAYRRRRFLPCLSEHSRGDDAISNRFVLEYWDKTAKIAPIDWNSTRTFSTGETVSHAGDLYVALSDSTNIAPPGPDWQYVRQASPAAWSSGSFYDMGDEVIDGDITYICLSDGVVGEPPDTVPHYWGRTNSTSGAWVEYKGQKSILEHECGVMFDSPEVPGEALTLKDENDELVRWRITCCVEGDRRVQGRATLRASSPNEQDVVLVLEMPDKFQDAQIVKGSKFSQSSTVVTTSTHARNDTIKILNYAKTIQEIEDCAQLNCSIMIEGMLHPELQIGMLVEKIDGVDVTLDANAASSGRISRYPQIVGLNSMTQMPQMCEVILETFKQERPEVTA